MFPTVHISNNDINKGAARTPSVSAFNIGSLMDIVDNKKTDYLAKPFDPKSLVIGINSTIEDEETNIELLSQALITAKVKREYSVISKKYISAYQFILNFD